MTAPVDNYVGLLVVDLVEARDLPSMDIGGKSDPYVDVIFGGHKVYKTEVIRSTLSPKWDEIHKQLVKRSEGKWELTFEVYDWDKMSHNDFIGSVKVGISDLFDHQVHDLWLPVHKKEKARGEIHLRFRMLRPEEVERKFWEAFAQHFDVNGTGNLDRAEFMTLLSSIASTMSDDAIAEMYELADADKSGHLSYEEVWRTIDSNRDVADKLLQGDRNLLWQVYAASDEFNNVGSLIMQKNLSTIPDHQEKKENMRVILVQERASGRLEEEKIPHYIEVSLRLMYRSKAGQNAVSGDGAKKILKHLTVSQGKKYDDPKSKKEIPGFIAFHQLNVDEMLDPLDSFKNFNEFFYRKLKPSARPISSPEDPRVAVSPADCRINVFPVIDEATRVWIKGRHFTLSNLLLDEDLAKKYEGGSLVIARLAPQDYHRFHLPVDGQLASNAPYDGTYYTVNPIAIREQIDVYTENKRMRTTIHSPQFGEVLYMAVGATMVGSINITSQQGAQIKKGDEHGYFAFGGSTVLVLFEKGTIRFDEDLVLNSVKPIETLIKMGDRIGVSAL
eukprot:TRINITY_DN4235_c0_g1_i1.p1 TRINITY_DN4235_c0_g1~~TRINITY_DN4235_c0_g1_i1.p1  ORF type:complete len:575 (+),score=184.18 TRINITY_DN4235_c0_g1_i1:53-1726(+)